MEAVFNGIPVIIRGWESGDGSGSIKHNNTRQSTRGKAVSMAVDHGVTATPIRNRGFSPSVRNRPSFASHLTTILEVSNTRLFLRIYLRRDFLEPYTLLPICSMPAEQSAASPSGAKEMPKQSAENDQAGDDRKEPTSPSKVKTQGELGGGASVNDASTDKKDDDAASRARQRQERFKALQARAVSSW